MEPRVTLLKQLSWLAALLIVGIGWFAAALPGCTPSRTDRPAQHIVMDIPPAPEPTQTVRMVEIANNVHRLDDEERDTTCYIVLRGYPYWATAISCGRRVR